MYLFPICVVFSFWEDLLKVLINYLETEFVNKKIILLMQYPFPCSFSLLFYLRTFKEPSEEVLKFVQIWNLHIFLDCADFPTFLVGNTGVLLDLDRAGWKCPTYRNARGLGFLNHFSRTTVESFKTELVWNLQRYGDWFLSELSKSGACSNPAVFCTISVALQSKVPNWNIWQQCNYFPSEFSNNPPEFLNRL